MFIRKDFSHGLLCTVCPNPLRTYFAFSSYPRLHAMSIYSKRRRGERQIQRRSYRQAASKDCYLELKCFIDIQLRIYLHPSGGIYIWVEQRYSYIYTYIHVYIWADYYIYIWLKTIFACILKKIIIYSYYGKCLSSMWLLRTEFPNYPGIKNSSCCN